MKKFILPLLLILFVSTLVAAQSEASDVVGYFKRNIPAGTWEPFAIPFGHDSNLVNLVLGSSFSVGDQIADIAGGDVYFFVDDWDGSGTPGWVGSSPEILPGRGYWLYRETGFVDYNLFQLGKVNPSTLVFLFEGNGGWNPFSLNESQPIYPNLLDITGAVYGDQIADVAGGDVFFYVEDDGSGLPGWVGSNPDGLLPTNAYWYNSFADAPFEWTYVPAPDSRNENSQTFRVSKPNKVRK